MQAFLHHPAVQGGLIPFIVALLAALLLKPLRQSGLALALALAASMYLGGDLLLFPFTSLRKILWLSLAASLAGVALNYLRAAWMRPLLAVLSGAAVVWVAWLILRNQPLLHKLLWGASGAVYAGWMVFWMDELRDKPVRAASAGLGLGTGLGASMLYGGYISLGVYGIALGAASGAYLLIQMIANKRLACGPAFTLPLSLVVGLGGAFGVMAVQTPAYILMLLAAIPIAALHVPASDRLHLSLQAVLLSAATLALAAVAVFLTRWVTGPLPI